MLIALFEHRTFVEACLWGINPFDQWGVELGKELATSLLPAVQDKASAPGASPATLGLLSQLRKWRTPS
jgi:glucose-6-phosphate isomerase